MVSQIGGWNEGGWGIVGTSLVRLAAAAVMGAVVGTEREHSGRSAGMRTHLLVALGAGLAMLVSLHFATVYASESSQTIRTDPARVAYGIMAGIGFLGAGAIVRHGYGIRGLTTAASLWCTAAIGLACGFGMFVVAGAATAMVLVALRTLHHVEERLSIERPRVVTIELPLGEGEAHKRYREMLTSLGGKVQWSTSERNVAEGTETLTFNVTMKSKSSDDELMSLDRRSPEIRRIKVE